MIQQGFDLGVLLRETLEEGLCQDIFALLPRGNCEANLNGNCLFPRLLGHCRVPVNVLNVENRSCGRTGTAVNLALETETFAFREKARKLGDRLRTQKERLA